MVSFVCRTKGANLMTNKKFKKAAMALALTACVAATPLAANAETPENAADVQAPAAVDHTEADTQEAPEAELPAEEEPEAQPAAEAAAQPAAPEATPIAVELPTAEETPKEEEAPEEKEETPVEVTPTEDAVVEKETPAEVATTEDAVVEKVTPAEADVDNLIEDPDAGIATMDGVEKEVSEDAATITGGKSYSTLDDALKDAKTGNEVVLQKNHTGNIKIAEWIKLNLNGKKIEGNVEVDLPKKQDDTATSQDGETAVEKKVEIVDGTITGGTDSGVKIIGADVELKDVTITGNKGTYGGGVSIDQKSNVTFTDCTITGNEAIRNGGGIYAKDSSTVTVNGGSISGNSAAGTNRNTSGGGGIYAEGGSTVDLNDTTIANNHVTGNYGSGGGVRVNNGTLSADHVKILENTTNSNGGGISVKDSVLTVTDSEIRNNVAGGSNGGGVEIIGSTTDNKEHTIINTEITGNCAEERGGGVYVEQASITIEGSTLDNNHAKHTDGSQASSEGGGLSVRGGKDVTLDNTKVTNNSAKDGGGIWVRDDIDTNVTIKNNCKITGNKSVYAGGGVMVRQDFNKKIGISIENSTIENNSAANGGGIYLIRKAHLDLKNTSVSNNHAVYGGALFLTQGASVSSSEKTTMNNNNTTLGGGSLWVESGSSAELFDTDLSHNTATKYGGAVYVSANSKATLTKVTLSDNHAATGGALFLFSNSHATLDNSEVSGNKATGNGGGVCVYDATCSLTTSNGTVFRENSGYRGGGIFSSGGTVTVEDSTFEKNTATDDGGAIAATQNSSLAVRNSKVLENKAADTAGGILAEKSTLEVTDSIIDGNRASVGGGLYIADIDAPGETKEDKPEHTITRTEITNNTADGQGIGGGIYLGAQKLTITDSKLTGNNTISKNGQTQGGAIVAYSPGDFTLDNTLIQGNTADVGGGIHVLSTKLRDSHIILCNNTRITGNVANQFGGGIFLDNMNNPAVLELVNASVDNNTANVAGGIGNYGSIVVLKDGAVLENNTAKQYGGGLYNRGKVTVESGATVMNNTASTYGGGLYNKGEATVESGAKLYNNHAALAGDDIYLAGKNSTLTLTKVGDDWMLDDCGHKITGWFLDGLDARWDADGKGEHVTNLDDFKADGYAVTKNEDGSYTITILSDDGSIALKAAHNVTPKPTPDPDPEPTPDPDTPDTPVSPEDPTTPPVQDATPDDAETPVTPGNPANPSVQDATPDTVAALPKTGVNWFTALAMALSGMALTVAGAFTSLFAKSKH